MSSTEFWKGKSVVVTGASSGMGLALCRELVARGARVGMLARRRERLEAACAALLEAGAEVSHFAADARSCAEVESAVKFFADRSGPCDVLIANAGIYRKTSGLQFDSRAALDVIETNVGGVLNAIGAVLPAMVERNQGHLVAVGSLGAMIGMPGAAAYCASKAAVVTAMESLRIDLRKTQVRVTTVCPGYVDTPMITDEERRTLSHLLTAEQAAKRILRSVERGRAEDWFPWQLRLQLKLLRAAPLWLYKLLAPLVEEMEENHPST